MKKVALCIILLSIIIPGFSQQQPEYSMYIFSGLYLSPAYAGSHDVLSTTAIYRAQWLKMPGSPQTASIAVHSPLTNNHIALGMIYTYDQIGPTKTNSLDVDFAYRIKVGKRKELNLSFGISAGFENYNASLSNIATTQPNDPSFTANSQNRWLPNVGFGFYAYSQKFFVGASVPHILSNRLNSDASLFATSTNIARQYQTILITGGYAIDIGSKVKFIPSALIKYIPVSTSPTFDFTANFILISRIWVGLGYRLNDAYIFTAAVNATKQLRIGYSYDLTVSPLNHFTSGTHEVMVSFDAGFKKGKMVKPEQINYF